MLGLLHSATSGAALARGAAAATLLLAATALFLVPEGRLGTAGLLGWLLILAGALELTLGRRRDIAGAPAMARWEGAVSALAGLFLVLDPPGHFLALTEIMFLWLAVRGLIQLLAASRAPLLAAGILSVVAACNLLLAALVAIDQPIEMLTVLLFGPTAEVRATLAVVVAAALLVSAAGTFAISSLRQGSV
jgi:uncharacterized membrane protein HdeD (DUF308 family)